MGALELAALRRRAREAGISPGIVARSERAKYHASMQAGLREPLAAKIVEPSAIQFEGINRWVVAICKPSLSRSVGEDLNELGFRAYCPLGSRIVYRGRVKGKRQRRVHQFAVFGRYLFVGEAQEPLSTYVHEGLVGVIGDSRGGWALNPRAVQIINEAELAGQWDDAPEWDGPRYKRGTRGILVDGPFAGFHAIIQECTRSGVKFDVNIFGRITTVASQTVKLAEELV